MKNLNRRAFLQTLPALAIAGVPLGKAAPQIPPSRRKRQTVATFKGFSCTNGNPAAVNALIGGMMPTILKVSFGDHLFDHSLVYTNGVKWMVSVEFVEDGLTLDAPTIYAAMEHPNWSGFVLLGNEPYDVDPIEWWNEVGAEQREIIMSVTPPVGKPPTRFLIPGGLLAGDHANFPAWVPGSWTWTLMNYIVALNQDKKVRGFHWHLYPNIWYNIDNAMDWMQTWIVDEWAGRLNVISEVGRPNDSPATQYNPANVMQAAAEHDADICLWYRQQPTGGSGDNYWMLQTPPAMNTAYGNQFKAL